MEDSQESYKIFSELPLQADLKMVNCEERRLGLHEFTFSGLPLQNLVLRKTVDLVRRKLEFHWSLICKTVGSDEKKARASYEFT